MSEVKVNSIKGVGASVAAISIDNADGTCTANITNNLSNRNLIINGAMQVAQRGTSSTSDSYQTVDRFRIATNSVDEAPTQAQVDVTSGTEPFTKGFRKAFKITNGNQTSGAGVVDTIHAIYTIEDQDLANSGWNYKSSSSYITLSFYVKSSVAQNFFFFLQSDNGSQFRYVMETGSLSADTWTKITKTIPGNSNLVFNNDNGVGMYIVWTQFDGTDRTGTRSLNAWGALDNTSRTPDQTSTWYTTNDATYEITGVQFEVGSVATDFEHRSFAQELALCRRYCQVYLNPKLKGVLAGSNQFQRMGMTFLETMRADPTASWSGTQKVYAGSDTASITGINVSYPDPNSYEFDAATSGTLSGGAGSAVLAYTGNSEGTLTLSAEL